jgi:hypothetical protein
VRVRRHGRWTPVDTTPAPTGSGTLAPTAVPVPTAFSAGGQAQPLAAAHTTAGRSVSFGFPGSLPAPQVSGSTAAYRNVRAGIDVLATATPTGFEGSLRLTHRPTAPLALALPLSLHGASVAQDPTSKALSFTDPAGQTVAHSAPPVMYGARLGKHSNEPTQVGTVATTITRSSAGPALVLRPDNAFLTDPATTYPVTIDPATNLAVHGDTYVQKAYPNSTAGASDPELKVGTYNHGAAVDRSFLTFNTAPIKNKNVTAATLHLWEGWAYSCTARQLQVRDAPNYAGTSTTWNTQPAESATIWRRRTFAYGWNAAGLFGGASDCPQPSGGVPINLTNAASTWASRSGQFQSVELRATHETDNQGYKKFSSANGAHPPRLSVTYQPVAPPSISSVRTDDTDTLRPALGGVASSPAGGRVTASFYLKDHDAGSVNVVNGATVTVGSGHRARYRVPAGKLRVGATYDWYLRACQSGACSDYSATHTFTINPNLAAGAQPQLAGTMSAHGKTEKINFQFQGQNSAGSLAVGSVQLRVVKGGGQLYLKAPASFWSKTAGPKAAALAGKWIKVPRSQAGNLSTVTLQGLAASLNTNDSPLRAKTTTGKANGRKALVLTQQNGDKLYVVDSRRPLPLKSVGHGTKKGTLRFTDYGKHRTISPPAHAQTVQQAAKHGTKAPA